MDQQSVRGSGLSTSRHAKALVTKAVRVVLAAVGCAALLAAPAVAGAVAPAQAAGTCNLVVPARLAVVSPYRDVALTVSSGCPASKPGGWATWFAYRPAAGPRDMVIFDGAARAGWDVYDSSTPYGVWTWRADSCDDADFNSCSQNSPTTDIRAGARSSLTSSRAGSYVTLTVLTSFYSQSASTFQAWADSKVMLQYRTPGTASWKDLRSATTVSDGSASYRTYSPSDREYRAVSASTSTTWGTTSAVTRR